MAVVESQDCNWEASGCARRSSLVCFRYDFKAAWKMVWKRNSETEVEEAATAEIGFWYMSGVASAEDKG